MPYELYDKCYDVFQYRSHKNQETDGECIEKGCTYPAVEDIQRFLDINESSQSFLKEVVNVKAIEDQTGAKYILQMDITS